MSKPLDLIMYSTYGKDCTDKNAANRATWAHGYHLRSGRDMQDLRSAEDLKRWAPVELRVVQAARGLWVRKLREDRSIRRRMHVAHLENHFFRRQAD